MGVQSSGGKQAVREDRSLVIEAHCTMQAQAGAQQKLSPLHRVAAELHREVTSGRRGLEARGAQARKQVAVSRQRWRGRAFCCAAEHQLPILQLDVKQVRRAVHLQQQWMAVGLRGQAADGRRPNLCTAPLKSLFCPR